MARDLAGRTYPGTGEHEECGQTQSNVTMDEEGTVWEFIVIEEGIDEEVD